MPPSTTPSPYNATSSPAAPFGFSGPKQYKLGRLRPLPREGARHPGLYEFTPVRVTVPSKQPANDSGGAGAVSTAADYLRFAQMLLNGGTLDGQRIMSRTTIRYMSSDHLGSRIQPAATPGGNVLAPTHYTFGLGFAVRPSDGIAGAPGTAGDYYWGGYAGTYFWVDPKEQITA